MGKHSKRVRYLGVSGKGKGKGKRPSRRGTKTKIASLNAGVAARKNQSPSSTKVLNELFFFV